MFIILAIVFLIIKILIMRFRELRKIIIRKLKNSKTHKEISTLYNRKDVLREEERFIEGKVNTVLLILFVGCLLSGLVNISNRMNPVLINGNTIMRPSYGKGEKSIELYAGEESLEKSQKIEFKIGDRVYSREETELMAEKVKEYIYSEIKNENSSVDMVRSDLNLMSGVDGYPFRISWKSDKPNILKNNGKIDYARLKKELKESGEESVLVKIYGTLEYEEYYEEIELAVAVYPPLLNEKEKFIEDVQEAITLTDKESRGEEGLRLPEYIGNMHITYSEKYAMESGLLFVLTLIMAAGVFTGNDSNLSKKVLERNDQMESDYPRIVNRYALYYCAGMHPKAVWKEICRDYRQRLSKGEERRYAFEEMLKCEALMNDGVGEVAALNDFASECRIKKYRSFVNMIEQSLIKGKEEMSDTLKREAEDAANERLMRAKIKGEEAGTKLLLPMFLMLLVVLIIVVVPAFINFRI